MVNPATELEVPVIDIGVLIGLKDDVEVQAKANDPSSPEGAALHKLTKELRAAATEWGFFYIANHGVSEQEIDDIREAAHKFLALPVDTKNQVRRTPDNSRGYFSDELTKNTVDWKEGFDFCGPEDLSESETDYKVFQSDFNQWLPEGTIPGFCDKLLRHYERTHLIARRLILLFALVLGKEATHLDQYFKTPKGEFHRSSKMRLNYYPVSPDPTKTIGVGQHTDIAVLTILLQDDDVNTLQVFHRESQAWHYVPPRKNTFVVNIGDMLQIWSNDRFEAALHRVKSSGEKNRLSVPFFYRPALEAVVEPILQEDGEKPRYRPLRWQDYLLKRIQGDYADLGEEIQITHYRI